MKFCPKCKHSKNLEFFSRDLSTSDGKRSHCKECCSSSYKNYRINNKEKRAIEGKEWRKNNPDAVINHNFKNNLKKFGLTVEIYNNMLKAQNHVCAICEKPEMTKRNNKIKQLSVDHCHATGKVRGLLCTKCNTGIGLLREDPIIIQKAKDYLTETNN